MNNAAYIDALIAKYLSGEASPEEAIQLEEWKEENPANLRYFEECKKYFGYTDDQSDVTKAWEHVSGQLSSEAKIRPLHARPRFVISIAAALVIIIGLGLTFKMFFRNNEKGFISQKTGKENKELLLPDRSRITVAPNSEIIYSKEYGNKERYIKLKGSAYFTVEHNETVPFIVDAGNVYIKDIGTRFDISTSGDTDTAYVRVDEGIVLLFDSAGSELTIKASEKAVYIKSAKKIIKQENTAVKQLPVLNFNNARLSDIALELEKAYELTVEIDNKAIRECRLTTSFNGEPIEQVLTIITETLGLRFEKTPSGYLLKGNACNG